jgi:hypothetical protein
MLIIAKRKQAADALFILNLPQVTPAVLAEDTKEAYTSF